MKEVKQTGRFVVVFVVFFLAAQFTRACIERIIQASYRFNLHTKYIAKKTEKKRRINIHPQEIPAIVLQVLVQQDKQPRFRGPLPSSLQGGSWGRGCRTRW